MEFAIHRRLDNSENGPSMRRLGGKRARLSGQLILTGRELHFLREGSLYLDVHTQDNVPGALKVNLSIPGS